MLFDSAKQALKTRYAYENGQKENGKNLPAVAVRPGRPRCQQNGKNVKKPATQK